MPINTLDNYIDARKEKINWVRNVSRTSVGGVPFTMFDVQGYPGSSVLSGSVVGNSASAAIMPTDDMLGYPIFQFTSGSGYLSKVEFANSVASRFILTDCLGKSGSYAFTSASTTVSIYPDISSRCPDTSGSTFGFENEIWCEVTTAFATGNGWQLQVKYTNQYGVTGKYTNILPVFNAAALTIGKMFRLSLATGDVGVQKIEQVIAINGGTAMTAGAFNILILRPIWSGRVSVANSGDVHDMLKTGLPLIYSTSAIYPIVIADSAATGTPEIYFEIASA